MPVQRNYVRYGQETTFFRDIAEFLACPVADGGQAIFYGDGLLELQVKNNHAATTIVMFHAAVNPAQTTLPVFIGQSIVEDIDANLIFVSEPALQRGAAIGWYAGYEGIDLQNDLTSVIAHIQDGIAEAKHLVFFGASAGGFAALHYAHRFPDSLAVVANPQTNITKYHEPQVLAYQEKCWAGRDLSETGICFDLVERYATEFPCNVAYLQNRDDELHVTEHLTPWLSAVTAHANRFRVHIGDWGEGHAPVPRFLLSGVLGFAAMVDGDWQTFFNDELFEDA